MLSEILPTSGEIYINNIHLNNNNIDKIRRFVGYCPQMNSFYP